MYFVYILKSTIDNSVYTGITSDIKRRIDEHNQGLSRYTKSRMPWKLVWLCLFPTQEKAANFEKYLKSGSGIAFSKKRLI
jgi:putative endonuclease